MREEEEREEIIAEKRKELMEERMANVNTHVWSMFAEKEGARLAHLAGGR